MSRDEQPVTLGLAGDRDYDNTLSRRAAHFQFDHVKTGRWRGDVKRNIWTWR